MADAEENFDLAAWEMGSGLNRRTTEALGKEDYTTRAVLKAMTVSDVAALHITGGQARALKLGLGTLGNPAFTDAPTRPVQPETARKTRSIDNVEEPVRRSETADAANSELAILQAGEALDRMWTGGVNPLPGVIDKMAAGSHGPTREAGGGQIEIENGRYVVVGDRPRIVSGLAAIPKADGSIRLIHDASRPAGTTLDDYADNAPFTYQTVQQAAASIQRGDYLAKVDLASAYRSVNIHPDDHQLAGLAWDFGGGSPTYLIDKRLMFGARLSASIFNTLSQAVCRFMAREGYPHITGYLDDYLIRGATKQECQQGLNRLLCPLRELGFAIAYRKVVPPTTRLRFLGIEFDTVDYVFRLPPDKLVALKEELETIKGRRSVTKKDLRSLTGRLSWASRVIY